MNKSNQLIGLIKHCWLCWQIVVLSLYMLLENVRSRATKYQRLQVISLCLPKPIIEEQLGLFAFDWWSHFSCSFLNKISMVGKCFFFLLLPIHSQWSIEPKVHHSIGSGSGHPCPVRTMSHQLTLPCCGLISMFVWVPQPCAPPLGASPELVSLREVFAVSI